LSTFTVVIWQGISQKFAIVRPNRPVTLQWHDYRIGLLNSVDKWRCAKEFFQKWCNFICLCAWASEGFYPGGPKVVIFVFLRHKAKKPAVFAELFKFLPHFHHLCLCVGKSWCHTI